jgi:hypothetical protein
LDDFESQKHDSGFVEREIWKSCGSSRTLPLSEVEYFSLNSDQVYDGIGRYVLAYPGFDSLGVTMNNKSALVEGYRVKL